MTTIDPITLGVVWGGLRAINQEMGAALKKTAFSLAVREAYDFSVGTFDSKGLLVAQGDFSPGHLGSMPFLVKHVISEYPPNEMEPGDVVIINDAYLGSGHLPDVFCVSPFFYRDELAGFTCNCAHHSDVGGPIPGSQAVENVYDLYAEGIRIPAVKLFRNGKLQKDILRLLLNNSRLPDLMEADLMAQVNANRVGERRLASLLESYGLETIKFCMREIIGRSEAAMREEIQKIPDGEYEYTDYFDDSGRGTDRIKVHVTIRINGGDITVDFTGSSPQSRAGFNSVLNYTYAYSFFTIKCVTDPSIPQNEGTIRPVKVVVPEGSFFNPRFPAPVSGRAIVNQRIYEVMNGALSKAVPDKVITAGSSWANPNFGGFNHRTGAPFVSYEIVVVGFGARANKDGCEGLASAFNISNVPVEVFETKVPLFVDRFEIIQDSGGAGKYRGGNGVRRDIKMLEDGINFSNLTDRHEFLAFGLFGGKPGARGMTLLYRGQEVERLHSKASYELKCGDVISQILNGAGGCGDPLERDLDAIQMDITAGYVSVAKAREDYGVMVDPESGRIDVEKTSRLRNEIKQTAPLEVAI